MEATSGDRSVTPEAVEVSLDIAGLGSRAIAWLLDTLIQLALLIPLGIALGVALAAVGPDATAVLVLFSLLYFLVLWGYYPFFETVWNGQTPGKRAQRLRVVRTDGQPVTFAPVMVRNLVRIVDVLVLPFLGVVSMLVTRRSQRLGDLAAGTMVVREHRAPVPEALDLQHLVPARPDLPGVDATGLTEREYDVVRSFLLRRDSLDPAARRALARRLVSMVRDRVGGPPANLDDEALLEAVARSYRDRFRPQA